MSKLIDTNNTDLPFVSVCTPTFNRRPFIPYTIKCMEQQDYPKDKIEWVIIDDGTDLIEDLVIDIPYVKYFKFTEKKSLGEKRNIMHQKSKGDIIVYVDDDDYYPPCRISHAVETLIKNPQALCCGSSEMHIYFKHINKLYQFGPYGPNHATAATFAFRRKLLDDTCYEDYACVGEEKTFLKNYTIPFAQLDTLKTILVFSHIHNSFDKKTLLENPNQFVRESKYEVNDFVKEPEILNFFLKDIDIVLDKYEPGDPKNKKDVIAYMALIKKTREEITNHMTKREENIQQQANQHIASVRTQFETRIAQLTHENITMKDKIEYLEKKITALISETIKLKKSSNLKSLT